MRAGCSSDMPERPGASTYFATRERAIRRKPPGERNGGIPSLICGYAPSQVEANRERPRSAEAARNEVGAWAWENTAGGSDRETAQHSAGAPTGYRSTRAGACRTA